MSHRRDLDEAVAAYSAFYETLTPESLHALDALCTPTVRFRDPFNDVTGVDAYRAILARMFEDVTDARFNVIDWARSERTAYLRWDFTFSTRRGAKWAIEGMSEVHFDKEGRVTAHFDHWDSGSQFYGRLPVLRQVIGFIRSRLARSR